MLRASSPASVESGGAKGQSDRTNESEVCSYHVCFPHPRHLPTPSLTATDQKVPPKCTLTPEAAELGGLRDTICTPIDSGHGDFLDYLVVNCACCSAESENLLPRICSAF